MPIGLALFMCFSGVATSTLFMKFTGSPLSQRARTLGEIGQKGELAA
jgi:hypothetical protein